MADNWCDRAKFFDEYCIYCVEPIDASRVDGHIDFCPKSCTRVNGHEGHHIICAVGIHIAHTEKDEQKFPHDGENIY